MLIDGHNRIVNYLRVSVTERCNFRCQYCMPDKPFSWTPRENLLSYEELFEFIKLAIDRGVNKIRITGGEPLLRENLDRFVYMIYNYKSDIDLALTTNGYLLKSLAKTLKSAGLNRVNISLDSLDSKKAESIAKRDILKDVIEGIDRATEVGLKVKLNSVVLKGINDNEILDILKFAKSRNSQIRYIEYMRNSFASELEPLPSSKVLEIISKEFNFKELKNQDVTSPAKYYQLNDGYKFGVIEPYKEDFCKNCNRIRLTAEGFLIPCLYFDEALSIKDAIKSKDLDRALDIFQKVLKDKPEKNRWSSESSNRAFYQTGG